MTNEEKLIVSREKFDMLLKSMIRGNVDFVVEEKKTSKCLLVNERLKAKYLPLGTNSTDDFWGEDISFKEGLSVYAALVKELNTYILQLEGEEVPKVKDVKLQRKKNADLWATMPVGSHFFAIDINNCWFQMAHRLGYIEDKKYKKWSKQTEYKRVVQRFLPMASSKTDRWTLKKGVRITLPLPFHKRMHNRMYVNVRNEANGIMEKVLQKLGTDFVYVNTDEIAVIGEKRLIVCQTLTEHGVDYKLTLCKKISELHYIYAGKKKNFHYKKSKKYEENISHQ